MSRIKFICCTSWKQVIFCAFFTFVSFGFLLLTMIASEWKLFESKSNQVHAFDSYDNYRRMFGFAEGNEKAGKGNTSSNASTDCIRTSVKLTYAATFVKNLSRTDVQPAEAPTDSRQRATEIGKLSITASKIASKVTPSFAVTTSIVTASQNIARQTAMGSLMQARDNTASSKSEYSIVINRTKAYDATTSEYAGAKVILATSTTVSAIPASKTALATGGTNLADATTAAVAKTTAEATATTAVAKTTAEATIIAAVAKTTAEGTTTTTVAKATAEATTTTAVAKITAEATTTTAVAKMTAEATTTTAAAKTTAEATTTETPTTVALEPWVERYYGIGCFISNFSPYLTLVKSFRSTIDWGDMSKTVQKCADYLRLQSTVSRFGYVKFFAIKFYGECWIGNVSTPFLYFKEGVAYDCYQDLVGADYSIYMFHFGPVERPVLKPFSSIGCYLVGAYSAIRMLIGSFTDMLDTSAKVSSCAKLANNRGYTYFALKKSGECWSDPGAPLTYNSAGRSTNCLNGTGGANEFSLYMFN